MAVHDRSCVLFRGVFDQIQRNDPASHDGHDHPTELLKAHNEDLKQYPAMQTFHGKGKWIPQTDAAAELCRSHGSPLGVALVSCGVQGIHFSHHVVIVLSAETGDERIQRGNPDASADLAKKVLHSSDLSELLAPERAQNHLVDGNEKEGHGDATQDERHQNRVRAAVDRKAGHCVDR